VRGFASHAEDAHRGENRGDDLARWVIGWAIDEYLHTDLVQRWRCAVRMRGELADEVICTPTAVHLLAWVG
jgi:hypothetical protein